MTAIAKLSLLAICACALAASGCGSSGSSSSAGPGAPSTAASPAGGALSAEARSAASGDIPDNQVFLLYASPSAGFSIKYPEGWTQSGAGTTTTFSSKNNIVRVTIGSGAPATIASVASDLKALRHTTPSLSFSQPREVTVGGARAVKATYTTQSAPDPVTGRGVLLIVDRYALAHGGRTALVDLGTPQGVDNVDAYKMMIESFHWR